MCVEREGIVVSKLEGERSLLSFDNIKKWGVRASFVNLGFIF